MDLSTSRDSTAIATISMARYSGGLYEDGEQHISAEMEMDGKLVKGSLKETWSHKTKTDVNIQIEFREHPQKYVSGYDETKYTGNIRFGEENNEVLDVKITLPISMYPTLQSMRGEQIKIEIIHDLISNPNDEQKADDRVAFIKRIYFEIQPDKETSQF